MKSTHIIPGIGSRFLQDSKGSPDDEPGEYYVSCRRDDGHFALVSGPYQFHAEALAMVGKAREISEDLDPRAVWYAFGTLRTWSKNPRAGVLQKWGYSLLLDRKD